MFRASTVCSLIRTYCRVEQMLAQFVFALQAYNVNFEEQAVHNDGSL
jgi:hypothetical protein